MRLFMRKCSFVVLILFLTAGVFAPRVYAQEAQESGADGKRAAVSIGPEWNMNSRKNFAGGAILGFDYNLGSSFALGINAAASNNFFGITVIEPAALFRWYFLPDDHTGWFVQADIGAYLIFEDGEITTLFMGGLKGGIRLPFGDMFFVEPYGRIGYPFAFGIGVMAGIKF
jgi:hypothetical protein